MKFLKRLKETFLALLPILVIVFFVHFFLYEFDKTVLLNFVIAVVIAAIGEALLSAFATTLGPILQLHPNAVTLITSAIIIAAIVTKIFLIYDLPT